jgi:hypothetical protein
MNAVDGRLWSVPRHRKSERKGNRHRNRRALPRGTDGSNPCTLQRRVSNELYRRWASMESGRNSHSQLRSQGLDYEVQGGNLCKMQAECNLFPAEIGDHLRCRARATARRVAGRAPEARPRILRGKGRSSHRAARAPDATPGPLLRSAKI